MTNSPSLRAVFASFNDPLLAAQEQDWTCVLAAFRTALRLTHRDMTEEDLLQHLALAGNVRDDLEILTAHLGLVARQLGFRAQLLMSERLVPELQNSDSELPVNLLTAHAQLAAVDPPRARLFSALRSFYAQGGLCIFPSSEFRPSVADIADALNRGQIVIAMVSGQEFYGIEEDWWHALTIIGSTDGRAIIYDGFAPVGHHFYPDWEHFLQAAADFDWTRWSREMLILDDPATPGLQIAEP